MGCTGIFITLHFTHSFAYDSTGPQPFWQMKIDNLINLVIKPIKVIFLISIWISDSKKNCTDSNYIILVGIKYITMPAPKWKTKRVKLQQVGKMVDATKIIMKHFTNENQSSWWSAFLCFLRTCLLPSSMRGHKNSYN